MIPIVEKEFTESEIIECRMLHTSIVEKHTDCNGLGFVRGKDGMEDCDCEAVYKYIRSLIYSRIPRRFWTVDFKSKDDLFASPADLRLFGDRGAGDSCIIFGQPNMGKTALLALIGKIGVWEKSNVFYLTVEDLLEFLKKDIENKVYLDRLAGASVILFDDITKFNPNEWAMGQVEHSLRKYYDNGINIIVVSSLPLDELGTLWKRDGLVSFLKKIEQRLIVNYTGKQSLTWTGYLSNPLLKEARAYFKNILVIN